MKVQRYLKLHSGTRIIENRYFIYKSMTVSNCFFIVQYIFIVIHFVKTFWELHPNKHNTKGSSSLHIIFLLLCIGNTITKLRHVPCHKYELWSLFQFGFLYFFGQRKLYKLLFIKTNRINKVGNLFHKKYDADTPKFISLLFYYRTHSSFNLSEVNIH